MSMLGSILSRIFGRSADASQTSQMPPAAGAAPTAEVGSTSEAMASGAAAGGTAAPAGAPVDIKAVLEEMAAKNPQKLNWQQSIVDLMKLLDLDSSLDARRTLAKELHYAGDAEDSAKMNVWLHREVMNKVAANGGKVPAELRD